MSAFLGMYDMPHLRASNDAFWHEIRNRLGFGPARLTRDADVWEIWHAPDLVFAQTCGLPYRARLHGHVQLVGTPDYGLPGCAPGYYTSVLIARQQDSDDPAEFAERTFAYNEALSQSGWAGPMWYLATRGITFTRYVQTGAHANSLKAVAGGQADLAGIDALTWQLLNEQGATNGLKVIATTDPVPGLPYITSAGAPREAIFEATGDAIAALPDAQRAALHLRGIVAVPAADYLAIPTPPPPPCG